MKIQGLSFGLAFTFLLLIGTVQSDNNFPSGFVWGAASAAYQVEGAWNVSDKGQSIWDVFTHIPNTTAHNQTGDVADDFYDLFPQDIALMKSLGLKHFRLSLSWPRLLPNGSATNVSQDGLTYYNNVINNLTAAGIEPWVTLYHWDLPAALNDNTTTGGWLNVSNTNAFQQYADFCFSQFGDRVKHWLTFNEVLTFAWLGYGVGIHAPGRCSPDVMPGCNPVGGLGNSSTEPYLVAHHVLIAHALAVNTYRTKYSAQGGSIGFTFNAGWDLPWNPNDPADQAAVNTSVIFNYAWFAEPLFTGDYPAEMRALVGDRLPTFTAPQQALLQNSTDFLGLNHYTSRFVRHTGVPGNSWGNDGQYVETDTDVYGNSIGAQAASTWLYVYPPGLRQLLRWIDDRYNSTAKPIYIFENGVSCPEELTNTLPNVLQDNFRVSYLQNYIGNLVYAMLEDNVNVKGYFTWSFTDNFEWADGYSVRFGLVYIDYTSPNLTRYNKTSAGWYSNAIQNITGGQNLTTVLHYLGLDEDTVHTVSE